MKKNTQTHINVRDLWLGFLKNQRRLSTLTLRAYGQSIDHFFEFLKNYYGYAPPLGGIQLKDGRAWLTKLQATHHERTRARHVAALRQFWRYMLQHSHTKDTSMLLLKGPRTKKTLPKPLDAAQVHTLLDCVKHPSERQHAWIVLRNYALITLLYGTGMRISEALSLTKASLPKNKTAPISIVIMGKGGKERHVPLIPNVLDALWDYLHACPFRQQSEFVFLGDKGQRMQAISARKVLQDAKAKASLLPGSLTPHVLRHTCASHLMAACQDLRGIQTLLGHARLSSTQIYTEINQQALLENYAAYHPHQKNKG